MHCDEAMLPGPSERYVPVVESATDEDLDPHSCEEDNEFFKSRPNEEEMEHAICKFLDGMPAVESKRYEQLHRHLTRLPVPDSKKIISMTQTEVYTDPTCVQMDGQRAQKSH